MWPALFKHCTMEMPSSFTLQFWIRAKHWTELKHPSVVSVSPSPFFFPSCPSLLPEVKMGSWDSYTVCHIFIQVSAEWFPTGWTLCLSNIQFSFIRQKKILFPRQLGTKKLLELKQGPQLFWNLIAKKGGMLHVYFWFKKKKKMGFLLQIWPSGLLSIYIQALATIWFRLPNPHYQWWERSIRGNNECMSKSTLDMKSWCAQCSRH